MLPNLPLPGEAFLITGLYAGKRGRLALVFLTAMLIINASGWWELRRQLREGYQDFTSFYAAGKILARHQGARLYDIPLQKQTQQEFAPYAVIRNLPYYHIPIEAALFVPFTRLPYFQAYLLWDLFSLMVCAAALLIIRPHLQTFRGQSALFWGLLVFSFFPAFIALVQGQDALLLLLLFALTYSALRKGESFTAGCWLGSGLFRFPVVLPLLLILARRSRPRLLGGFILTSALMALSSVALVGWKTALSYPAFLLGGERSWTSPIVSPDMPNLRGLLETVSYHAAGTWAFRAAVVLLGLALLWFCSNLWHPHADGVQFDLGYSLAIVAAILASYHAFTHDLTILLIPALLIANYCQLRPQTWRNWTVTVPMFLLFFTPLCAALLFWMRLARLLAVVLLIWLWGIGREISRAGFHQTEAYPCDLS